MHISLHTVSLKKRFPLTISRGVRDASENVFVRIEKDGIIGWGEGAPGGTEGTATVAEMRSDLDRFLVSDIANKSIYELYEQGRQLNIAPCAYAAMDMALWDWTAKKAEMPLHQLLGFPKVSAPTSVTIGINPPEVIKERIPLLLEGTAVKSLKIKLGSPEGIEADKVMFSQVAESVRPYHVALRIDANGGWNVEEAKSMMQWLSRRDVDYVEQPLKEGEEQYLKELFTNRPLPIFVDESCRFAHNIPQWANYVDGVNLKLMKCGGITEALRIIATAHAFNLKTMIGCMSESSVAIAAGAAISGIIDHVDLDSHYNLAPDPSEGAPMVNGVTFPADIPGHGAQLKSEYYVAN